MRSREECVLSLPRDPLCLLRHCLQQLASDDLPYRTVEILVLGARVDPAFYGNDKGPDQDQSFNGLSGRALCVHRDAEVRFQVQQVHFHFLKAPKRDGGACECGCYQTRLAWIQFALI